MEPPRGRRFRPPRGPQPGRDRRVHRGRARRARRRGHRVLCGGRLVDRREHRVRGSPCCTPPGDRAVRGGQRPRRHLRLHGCATDDPADRPEAGLGGGHPADAPGRLRRHPVHLRLPVGDAFARLLGHSGFMLPIDEIPAGTAGGQGVPDHPGRLVHDLALAAAEHPRVSLRGSPSHRVRRRPVGPAGQLRGHADRLARITGSTYIELNGSHLSSSMAPRPCTRSSRACSPTANLTGMRALLPAAVAVARRLHHGGRPDRPRHALPGPAADHPAPSEPRPRDDATAPPRPRRASPPRARRRPLPRSTGSWTRSSRPGRPVEHRVPARRHGAGQRARHHKRARRRPASAPRGQVHGRTARRRATAGRGRPAGPRGLPLVRRGRPRLRLPLHRHRQPRWCG